MTFRFGLAICGRRRRSDISPFESTPRSFTFVVDGDVDVDVEESYGVGAGSEVEEDEAGVDGGDAADVGTVLVVVVSILLRSASTSGFKGATFVSLFSLAFRPAALCSSWICLYEPSLPRWVSDATEVSVVTDDEGETEGEEADEENDTADELSESRVGVGNESSSSFSSPLSSSSTIESAQAAGDSSVEFAGQGGSGGGSCAVAKFADAADIVGRQMVEIGYESASESSRFEKTVHRGINPCSEGERNERASPRQLIRQVVGRVAGL